MVPAPTYQNLPTFGTGASLVAPVPGTYSGGYLPGQLFPAENENWLMNYITANSNISQASVVNLVAEMGTILAAASITPAAGLTDQVYSALNLLYAPFSEVATARNATNLTSGTIPAARFPNSINLNHGFEVLTSGTTYTVPSGVFNIWVTTIGGGGGGASSKGSGESGGGGGAGAKNRSYLSVTPGSSISYTIGNAGSGAVTTDTNGGDGGTTTFTGATSSAGGKGGKRPSNGSLGGIGSGGNIGEGGYGSSGSVVAFSPGGNGGGAGGAGGVGTNGTTPGSYGGGGGGGSTQNDTIRVVNSGGDGAQGAILIEY